MMDLAKNRPRRWISLPAWKALAIIFAATGGLYATGTCTNGTMDLTSGYQAPSFACMMGTIQFDLFTLSVNESGVDSGQYTGPSSITVTPNLGNSSFSFGINPPSWGNTDTVTFLITLRALETDGAKKINALGSSFNDNEVFDDAGTLTLSNKANCSSGCLSTTDFADTSSTAGAGNPILGSNGVNGPIMLAFEVDMNMPADDSLFTQIIHFSEVDATIGDAGVLVGAPAPEPATIVFAACGLAALLVRRRRAK